MSNKPPRVGVDPAVSAAMDTMRDQLLIVLMNRLGGKAAIPVAEIDATGQFVLSMQLDTETRTFHFEVGKKQ